MYDDNFEYDDFEEDYFDEDIDIEELRNSVISTAIPDVKLQTSVIISEKVVPVNNEEDVATAKEVKEVADEEPVSSVEDTVIGDYNSTMPDVPEDIVTFDIEVPDVNEDYVGGEIKVTKSFSEMRYPQLRVSERIMEHKYVVDSLKALLITKAIKPKADEMCFDVIIPFSDGDIIRIGVMPSRNLSNFLTTTIFSDIDKEIYLSENSVIRGDLMHALCTTGGEDCV